ncbi:MAG: hypothetical protein ACFFCO_02500 [Promethearchaeota archaeon]
MSQEASQQQREVAHNSKTCHNRESLIAGSLVGESLAVLLNQWGLPVGSLIGSLPRWPVYDFVLTPSQEEAQKHYE